MPAEILFIIKITIKKLELMMAAVFNLTSVAYIANRQSPIANRQSPIANRQLPIANRQSPIANRQSPIATYLKWGGKIGGSLANSSKSGVSFVKTSLSSSLGQEAWIFLAKLVLPVYGSKFETSTKLLIRPSISATVCWSGANRHSSSTTNLKACFPLSKV